MTCASAGGCWKSHTGLAAGAAKATTLSSVRITGRLSSDLASGAADRALMVKLDRDEPHALHVPPAACVAEPTDAWGTSGAHDSPICRAAMRTAEIATAGQPACCRCQPRSVDSQHKTRPTGRLARRPRLSPAGPWSSYRRSALTSIPSMELQHCAQLASRRRRAETALLVQVQPARHRRLLTRASEGIHAIDQERWRTSHPHFPRNFRRGDHSPGNPDSRVVREQFSQSLFQDRRAGTVRYMQNLQPHHWFPSLYRLSEIYNNPMDVDSAPVQQQSAATAANQAERGRPALTCSPAERP